MDLVMSSSVDGTRAIVQVGGEIDVYTAPLLRRGLDEHIHQGCRELVVDLSGVTFLDSTGLGVLVGRLKLLRSQGGSMKLVGASDRVLRVFGITGLDRVFDIERQADLQSADEADPAAQTDYAGEPWQSGSGAEGHGPQRAEQA